MLVVSKKNPTPSIALGSSCAQCATSAHSAFTHNVEPSGRIIRVLEEDNALLSNLARERFGRVQDRARSERPASIQRRPEYQSLRDDLHDRFATIGCGATWGLQRTSNPSTCLLSPRVSRAAQDCQRRCNEALLRKPLGSGGKDAGR